MGISYKYFLQRQEFSLREWKSHIHRDWQSTERGLAQVHSLMAHQINVFQVFTKNRGKRTLLSPVRKHMHIGIALWQSLKSFPPLPQTFTFWARIVLKQKNNSPAMKNHLLFPVVFLNSHDAANITVTVILKLWLVQFTKQNPVRLHLLEHFTKTKQKASH